MASFSCFVSSSVDDASDRALRLHLSDRPDRMLALLLVGVLAYMIGYLFGEDLRYVQLYTQ